MSTPSPQPMTSNRSKVPRYARKPKHSAIPDESGSASRRQSYMSHTVSTANKRRQVSGTCSKLPSKPAPLRFATSARATKPAEVSKTSRLPKATHSRKHTQPAKPRTLTPSSESSSTTPPKTSKPATPILPTIIIGSPQNLFAINGTAKDDIQDYISGHCTAVLKHTDELKTPTGDKFVFVLRLEDKTCELKLAEQVKDGVEDWVNWDDQLMESTYEVVTIAEAAQVAQSSASSPECNVVEDDTLPVPAIQIVHVDDAEVEHEDVALTQDTGDVVEGSQPSPSSQDSLTSSGSRTSTPDSSLDDTDLEAQRKARLMRSHKGMSFASVMASASLDDDKVSSSDSDSNSDSDEDTDEDEDRSSALAVPRSSTPFDNESTNVEENASSTPTSDPSLSPDYTSDEESDNSFLDDIDTSPTPDISIIVLRQKVTAQDHTPEEREGTCRHWKRAKHAGAKFVHGRSSLRQEVLITQDDEYDLFFEGFDSARPSLLVEMLRLGEVQQVLGEIEDEHDLIEQFDRKEIRVIEEILDEIVKDKFDSGAQESEGDDESEEQDSQSDDQETRSEVNTLPFPELRRTHLRTLSENDATSDISSTPSPTFSRFNSLSSTSSISSAEPGLSRLLVALDLQVGDNMLRYGFFGFEDGRGGLCEREMRSAPPSPSLSELEAI